MPKKCHEFRLGLLEGCWLSSFHPKEVNVRTQMSDTVGPDMLVFNLTVP